MRKVFNINENWEFHYSKDGSVRVVNLPHTWNGEDGQDGGNDYYRGVCAYTRNLSKPEISEGGYAYLEFKGVNSSAKVYVNGEQVCSHDGGYSAFRCDITKFLQDKNEIRVEADNSVNDRVYPQRADFTFYGGIYRDVNLITVGKEHFDLDYFGCNPIKVEPRVDGTDGSVKITAYANGGEIAVRILDGEGNEVVNGANGETFNIKDARLWNGLKDPYVYSARAELYANGEKVDEISTNFGFRSFKVDPEKGFFLNGKPYPLRGVCRHQDRPRIGNALTKTEHDEDMELIKEIGANTLRLAHYQHDDYFYDLCDRAGLVVWAEIPYISKHMNGGDENAKSQMKELILQQYNHPSIVFWGISNEITMMKCDKKDMLKTHRELNALCHELDSSRLTTLACFAMCGFGNKSAHITDVVSWNLYLGWYVPGLFLNKLWFGAFRAFHPKRCVGLSEYGAESMPNLHAKKPRRFDNTEDYQAIYHEYMTEFFSGRDYLWATHVWNMFDFAADGRNQGGEPGMNHKGLVTFDRKTKKDAFYLYKAYWSEEPVLHICGKRYVHRTGKTTKIKVYSNLGAVDVYNNGRLVASPKPKKGGKVYECTVKLEAENEIKVTAGGLTDAAAFIRYAKPDPAYKVTSGNSMSWEK